MPIKKLRSFLDERGIKYVSVIHSRAFTAQEVAASVHVPGREMAKTVMINVEGKMAMAVLPAMYRVDLAHLAEAIGTNDVVLATEDEFKEHFRQCEPGAMPPFGNLYGMTVFMDSSLTETEEIVFNAGTHTEVIRMAFPDYAQLVEPVELHFALELA